MSIKASWVTVWINAVAARIPNLKKKARNLLIRKFLQLRRVTRKFLQNLGAPLVTIYWQMQCLFLVVVQAIVMIVSWTVFHMSRFFNMIFIPLLFSLVLFCPASGRPSPSKGQSLSLKAPDWKLNELSPFLLNLLFNINFELK